MSKREQISIEEVFVGMDIDRCQIDGLQLLAKMFARRYRGEKIQTQTISSRNVSEPDDLNEVNPKNEGWG